MPLPSTSTDPYFAPDGEFSQHGTFFGASFLGQYIVNAFKGREPDNVYAFQHSIEGLVNAFKHNPLAKKAFLDMLDDLRAEGLVEMVLRRAPHEQYHIPEHPAEFAYDVEKILMKEFHQEYPDPTPNQTISNEIFIGIAKAAAAWHDIVQNQGAPNNEIESAQGFVGAFLLKLEIYKKDYKLAAEAVTAFERQLDFIARELILHGTWLVLGMKDKNLSAKCFAEYIDQTVAETSPDELDMNAISPALQHLTAARKAMSTGDTKRYSLDHVKESRILLTAFQAQPEADREGLEKFFIFAEINEDVCKEEFLGLMCQNLRIFTELNQPNRNDVQAVNIAKINDANHREFFKALDAYRNGKPVDRINHLKLFNLLVNTKKNRKSNLLREQEFANALGDELWKRHAQHLESFMIYIDNAQFKAPMKIATAKILFQLATQHQHGSILLNNDKLFHDRLEQLATLDPDQKDSARDSSSARFFGEDSQRKLSVAAKKNLKVAIQRFSLTEAHSKKAMKP